MFLMGRVVDTIYDICIEIEKDGIKMLEKYFIINTFDNIGKEIPELKISKLFFSYKKIRTVATREVVLPLDHFTEEIFYPNRVLNQATTQVETKLFSEAAIMIMMVFTDTRKANSKHLACIQGEYIMLDTTE